MSGLALAHSCESNTGQQHCRTERVPAEVAATTAENAVVLK